jgi:hypothetical protein
VSVPPHLESSMDLQNMNGPFITKPFAENLALLVVQQRYSKDIFVARTPVTVGDAGDSWLVTVDNSLPLEPKTIKPFHLTVVIRKKNGEILGVG